MKARGTWRCKVTDHDMGGVTSASADAAMRKLRRRGGGERCDRGGHRILLVALSPTASGMSGSASRPTMRRQPARPATASAIAARLTAVIGTGRSDVVPAQLGDAAAGVDRDFAVELRAEHMHENVGEIVFDGLPPGQVVRR